MENDVDIALKGNQLINISLDYKSMRDILAEMALRVEKLQKQFTDFSQNSEVDRQLELMQSQIDNMNRQFASRPSVAPSEAGIDEEFLEKRLNDFHRTIIQEIYQENRKVSSDILNQVDKTLERQKPLIIQEAINGAVQSPQIESIKTRVEALDLISQHTSTIVTPKPETEAVEIIPTTPGTIPDDLVAKLQNCELSIAKMKTEFPVLGQRISQLEGSINKATETVDTQTNAVAHFSDDLKQLANNTEDRLVRLEQRIRENSGFQASYVPTMSSNRNIETIKPDEIIESCTTVVIQKVSPKIDEALTTSHKVEERVEKRFADLDRLLNSEHINELLEKGLPKPVVVHEKTKEVVIQNQVDNKPVVEISSEKPVEVETTEQPENVETEETEENTPNSEPKSPVKSETQQIAQQIIKIPQSDNPLLNEILEITKKQNAEIEKLTERVNELYFLSAKYKELDDKISGIKTGSTTTTVISTAPSTDSAATTKNSKEEIIISNSRPIEQLGTVQQQQIDQSITIKSLTERVTKLESQVESLMSKSSKQSTFIAPQRDAPLSGRAQKNSRVPNLAPAANISPRRNSEQKKLLESTSEENITTTQQKPKLSFSSEPESQSSNQQKPKLSMSFQPQVEESSTVNVEPSNEPQSQEQQNSEISQQGEEVSQLDEKVPTPSQSKSPEVIVGDGLVSMIDTDSQTLFVDVEIQVNLLDEQGTQFTGYRDISAMTSSLKMTPQTATPVNASSSELALQKAPSEHASNPMSPPAHSQSNEPLYNSPNISPPTSAHGVPSTNPPEVNEVESPNRQKEVTINPQPIIIDQDVTSPDVSSPNVAKGDMKNVAFSVPKSSLSQPTSSRFNKPGRVVMSSKDGTQKVYDSVTNEDEIQPLGISSPSFQQTNSSGQRSSAISPKVSSLSQTYAELEDATRRVQEELDALRAEVSEMSARQEEAARVLSALSNTAADTRELGQLREEQADLSMLVEDLQKKIAEAATIPALRTVTQNFLNTLQEMDKRLEEVRVQCPTFVTRKDLNEILSHLATSSSPTDTAVGRLGYRCLLCGKPASTTGMITESEVARMLGTPPQQCNARDPKMVLQYSKDAGRQSMKQKKLAPLPPVGQ